MKTILNCLLLLAITSIYSQNTIEGIVTESDSSTPITFANIYLPLLEKGAITDDDGKFIISNLPSGNYKIIVSIIGYETFSKTINIP